MQKLAVPGKSSGARTEEQAVCVLLLHVGDYVLPRKEGMAAVVAHLLRLVLAYDNMCSRQANIWFFQCCGFGFALIWPVWIRIRIRTVLRMRDQVMWRATTGVIPYLQKLLYHPKLKPRRGGGLRQIKTCRQIPYRSIFKKWRPLGFCVVRDIWSMWDTGTYLLGTPLRCSTVYNCYYRNGGWFPRRGAGCCDASRSEVGS